MIRALLPRLAAGESLTREEAAGAVRAMVGGEADPAAIGAFLMALASRGEREEELLGGAQALREAAIPFSPPYVPLLDTCGTGGDGSHSFNVSTAVAFVAAAAGVPVAKHGNRSVSSRCGSANVLEALGAVVDLDPDACEAVLRDTGFCFLYARRFHPAVGRVAPVREALGIRTLFNWLGPLANPAGATHQLLGISERSRVEPVARVLAALGVVRALVVHGGGTLDELALDGENAAVLIAAGGTPEPVRIDAETLGLRPAPNGSLRGGDAAANAGIVRRVFSGATGPARDVVVLNAAAALWVSGAAASLDEGARRAERVIDEGAATRALEGFVAASRRHAGPAGRSGA